MATSTSLFFIVDGPKLIGQAHFLAASLLRHRDPDWTIIAYHRADAPDPLPASLLWLFDAAGIEPRPIPGTAPGDTPVWHAPYPIGNKILAAAAPRDTAVSVFLDTDVLLNERIDFAELLGDGRIAAGYSDYRTDVDWQAVYDHFGQPMPDARPGVLKRPNIPYPPYFNAGVIAFDDRRDARGVHFGEAWLRAARSLENDAPFPLTRNMIDQITLPPLGAQLDSPVRPLAQRYNYNLQGWGAEHLDQAAITHYHQFNVLWSHPEAARPMLETLCDSLPRDRFASFYDGYGEITDLTAARAICAFDRSGRASVKAPSPDPVPAPALQQGAAPGPRLSLHLGAYETASPVFQSVLRGGQPQLAAAGVTLAQGRNPTGEAATEWSLLRDRMTKFSRNATRRGKHEALLRETFAKYLQALRQHRVDHLLLSEDGLLGTPLSWYMTRGERPLCYPFSAELAALLAEMLAGCPVRILFHTRRQDSWFRALYLEGVTGLHFDLSFGEFIDQLRGEGWQSYRFDRILQPWIDAFGPERVHIRPYEELSEGAGVFARGALSAFDIAADLPAPTAPPEYELDAVALRAAQARLLYRQAEDHGARRRLARQFARGRATLPDCPPADLTIPPAVQGEITRAFADDLSYQLARPY